MPKTTYAYTGLFADDFLLLNPNQPYCPQSSNPLPKETCPPPFRGRGSGTRSQGHHQQSNPPLGTRDLHQTPASTLPFRGRGSKPNPSNTPTKQLPAPSSY